jgi:3-phenylpropionate/trans-cinnamate dioxygenase ferredoxin reductase component
MPQVFEYLVVGGGVAGGHAVFEIRRKDKSGKLGMVNEEDQFPYDRPPLSKEYLGGRMKRSELFFRADSYFGRNKVEVFRGSRVQAIDTSDRIVTLDGGRELSYDKLLLATGGRVRKLELPGSDLSGIYYLRTLHDCDVIKKAASASRRMVIVGGGFIGCELAATLTRRGLKVTLIELAPRLLSAAIDEETSHWVQEYHSKKGVSILMGTKTVGFRGNDGRVAGVELEGGKIVPADFVVVGVGIIPNTELAEKAGLKVDRGIVVDDHLRTGADGVYAAGDVARFYSPIFKKYLRVEHVDVAQKQGGVAGMNMVGQEKSFDELPYFFSNQFDLEINAFGDLSQHTAVVRRGQLGSKEGFIQFYFDGNVLNGILSVNANWNEIERAKTLILNREGFAEPSAFSDESRNLKSFAGGT